MNRTITLAGPNNHDSYVVVETTNYLHRKPGEWLSEQEAMELADSMLVEVKFVPPVAHPQVDPNVRHAARVEFPVDESKLGTGGRRHGR